MSEYIEPAHNSSRYTCPHCGTLAQITSRRWSSEHISGEGVARIRTTWSATECGVCSEVVVWFREERRWPMGRMGPPPHDDMPANVKQIYREAADVGSRSPRAAGALLRLALQVLLTDLSSETNLNNAIGALVADGMPVRIQQAMDVLRVVGNNAVHPGQISVDDNPAIVTSLFKVLNVIVENRVAQPSEINSLYDTLPATAREAIEARDQDAL